MAELNPEHPVTKKLNDTWHTLCLLIMKQFGKTEVIITQKDFHDVIPGESAIVVQEMDDGLHVMIMPMNNAIKLAEREKERMKLNPEN
jgi:hypothetical protein